jgi:hypothetical protein
VSEVQFLEKESFKGYLYIQGIHYSSQLFGQLLILAYAISISHQNDEVRLF